MSTESQTFLYPESKTIGEIVAENFNAAGVFRHFGMDFCCGGGITIEKACEKKNVDLDELINELQKLDHTEISANQNYRAWEPVYLIDHIIDTHHRYVNSKLDEISSYAKKVASVHGTNAPENIEIHKKFTLLANEMAEHMDDEETRVFPLINRISEKRKKGELVSESDISELKTELRKMEDDHENAGQLMKDIRQLSHNFTPPSYACATYRILYQNLEAFEADLHKHVHLENNILFKKAELLIQ